MRGYFGIGIYEPKWEENIGTLWRSSFIFGAVFIFTIGKKYKKQPTDTPDTVKHIPLFNFENFNDFKNKIPINSKLICIELIKEAESLHKFIHPERAVYLLGSEDHGIPEEIYKVNTTISIPQKEKFSLNVAVAGSIVMADRYFKNL